MEENESVKQNVFPQTKLHMQQCQLKGVRTRNVSVLGNRYHFNNDFVQYNFVQKNKKNFFQLESTDLLNCVYQFVDKIIHSEDLLQDIVIDIGFKNTKFKNQIKNQLKNQYKEQNYKLLEKQFFGEQKFRTKNTQNHANEQKKRELININKGNNPNKSNNPNEANNRKNKTSIQIKQEIQDLKGLQGLVVSQDKSQVIGSELFSCQSFQSQLFSCSEINHLKLNKSLLIKLYGDQPQVYLLNLSICLLLKFLSFSSIRLNSYNICWMLSICTIISYKLYFDHNDQIDGIVQCFAHMLTISNQDVVRLERIVLEQIAFQTIIHHSIYYHVADIIIRQANQP